MFSAMAFLDRTSCRMYVIAFIVIILDQPDTLDFAGIFLINRVYMLVFDEITFPYS